MTGRRVDRETALVLLSGPNVTLFEHKFTVDVDGDPIGMERVDAGSGTLHVKPEHLGWTWAELGFADDDDDDDIPPHHPPEETP